MKASAFAALAAAALAMTVSAQTSPPPRSDIAPAPDSSATTDTMQFGTVDQNKDGRISRAEAMSHGGQLGVAFATLDADRDAYLSQAEYGKWTPGKAATPDGSTAEPVRPVPGAAAPPRGNASQPGTGIAAPGSENP